jgi:hypothetical protein
LDLGANSLKIAMKRAIIMTKLSDISMKKPLHNINASCKFINSVVVMGDCSKKGGYGVYDKQNKHDNAVDDKDSRNKRDKGTRHIWPGPQ